MTIHTSRRDGSRAAAPWSSASRLRALPVRQSHKVRTGHNHRGRLLPCDRCQGHGDGLFWLDLGTGIATALLQMVAEELDVPLP